MSLGRSVGGRSVKAPLRVRISEFHINTLTTCYVYTVQNLQPLDKRGLQSLPPPHPDKRSSQAVRSGIYCLQGLFDAVYICTQARVMEYIRCQRGGGVQRNIFILRAGRRRPLGVMEYICTVMHNVWISKKKTKSVRVLFDDSFKSAHFTNFKKNLLMSIRLAKNIISLLYIQHFENLEIFYYRLYTVVTHC